MRREPVLVGIAALVLLASACGRAPATDPDAPAGAAGVPAAQDDAGSDPTEEGSSDDGDRDGTADAAPTLRVVATVAPISDLVSMVGGDRVQVTSLVPAGADSHTYAPRPSDVALLAEADAYLGVGLGLNDGAVRLARENLGDGVPLVLLGEVALADDQLVFDHSHGDDDHGHSHGDDDHGHSHGDDGGLGPNPHVWTSVRNAAALLDPIADTLGELDPEGAEVYVRNADRARAALLALDDRIGRAVTTIPEGSRTLVTYHDAWSYFARDHGLAFAVAIQPSDFTEPSAAEVGAVIDLIRERDVPAVFGSEVFPTRVLEAIAEETGATYVEDLADDVLPGQPGDPEHTYLELMRRNAELIVSGLGGDPTELR